MAYQQKEGQGSLFINEKTSLNHPDYKGTIMIDGKLYDLAAWQTTARSSGRDYLSLKAEPHVERQFTPREQEPPRSIAKAYSKPEEGPDDTMYTNRKDDFFAPEDPNDPDLPF